MSDDFGDFDAWEAAAMAPAMTCGICGDDIIWHRTRARWEHIGTYDHEADGPEPLVKREACRSTDGETWCYEHDRPWPDNSPVCVPERSKR